MLSKYILFAFAIIFVVSCRDFGKLSNYNSNNEENSNLLGRVNFLERKLTRLESLERDQAQLEQLLEDDNPQLDKLISDDETSTEELLNPNLYELKMMIKINKTFNTYSKNSEGGITYTPITEDSCKDKYGSWDQIFNNNMNMDSVYLLEIVRCYYEVEMKKDKSVLNEEIIYANHNSILYQSFEQDRYITYTPLTIAVSHLKVPLVRYLLAQGADIFHEADSFVNVNIFHLLTSAGKIAYVNNWVYDKNEINNERKSRNNIFNLIMDEIKRRGINLSDDKKKELEETKKKLLNSVLEKKPAKEFKRVISRIKICGYNYGVSPLIVAICYQDDDLTSSLIKNGADVNSKHRFPPHDISLTKGALYEDISPLHIAAQFGTFNAIKLLIENKANINSITKKYPESKDATNENPKRYTPLDLVPTDEKFVRYDGRNDRGDARKDEIQYLDYTDRSNAEIKKFLIEKGAKPATEISE